MISTPGEAVKAPLVREGRFPYLGFMNPNIQRYGTTVRWSDAVVHAGTAYAVEVAADLPADARNQSLQVLCQLEATLERAGSSKTDLLMCTVYLRDLADKPAFDEVWDAWLVPGTAPVRACVQAGLAHPDYRVEIQAVAAVSRPR